METKLQKTRKELNMWGWQTTWLTDREIETIINSVKRVLDTEKNGN